jgi:DNA-binding response OmpR family regulator
VQNAKVLIVDDEADVIQALKLRLETAGYDAVTAADGVEALKMLHRIDVDLILADLMMPNLDGLELTRRVRQDPRWFRIQVLLFSSHDDPVARGLALEFGALDYLSKTLGAHAIVSRVDEVLANARSWEETAERKPGYEAAERDLITQLQALSPNLAGTPPCGNEVLDPKPEGLKQSGESAAADLRNLAEALRGRAKVSRTQGSDSGK